MDQNAFEITRQLLQEAGFVIDETDFDCEDFGSWFVCVRSNPRFRIVWDGRDGLLLVQRETSKNRSGLRVWEDTWAGRCTGNQSPKIAVDKVKKLSG
jgi:hypothetical protein